MPFDALHDWCSLVERDLDPSAEMLHFLRQEIPDAESVDPWQVEAITSNAQTVALLVCRQAGKSCVLATRGVRALKNGGTTICLAPAERQMREITRKVQHYLRATDLVVERATQTEIKCSNGGRFCHNGPYEITMMRTSLNYELTNVICTLQLAVSAFNEDQYPEDKMFSVGFGGMQKMLPAIAEAFAVFDPYTLPSSHKQLIREVAQENNSVRFFLEESPVVRVAKGSSDETKARTSEHKLYKEYWSFCFGPGGAKPVGSRTFRQRMREMQSDMGYTLEFQTNQMGVQEAYYGSITLVTAPTT